MDAQEQLGDVTQDADHAATDARNFAGTAIQYAKDANFKMFNQTIDSAIRYAESLPHQLRALKRFVEQHPELDRGGF